MADFNFNCPHCDQSLEAPEDMLGETIECPSCNGSIQLPEPEPKPQRQITPHQRKIIVPTRTARPRSPASSSSAPAAKTSTSRKKIAIPLISFVLILAAFYLASPYWNLHRMRRAVENNDAVYMSDHVDFPQLRESLKATLQAQMAKEVAKDDADGFEALGAAFGAMMIGPMVDALVTPEALIAMMQGKDLDEIEAESSDSGGSPQAPQTTDEEMNVTKMGYEKLNRFVVKVADPGEDSQSDESLTLVFHRSGLFSWKLAGIRLKME